MSTQKSGITLKGCVRRCKDQLDRISSEITALTFDDTDTDIEKLDAILVLTEAIERRCKNIREYMSECNEY